MRPLFLLWFICAAIAGQTPRRVTAVPQAPVAEEPPVKPEERCSLEGSIFNISTGEPVKKASVTLRRAGGGGGPMGPGGMIYTATTDAAGHYAISGIDPGKYRLTVEKAGFVDQQYGAKHPGGSGSGITLEKSQRLRDISFKLTPHGVIAGRVLDDDGDPIVNATVQALERTYVRGRKSLTPVDNTTTNDIGEYRIFGLAPGRYFVSATYRRAFRGQPTQDADQETYAPTYYPAGSAPDMAAPLDVQPGSQFRGLDIRLRKTRAVRVQGRVVGASSASGRGGTNVMLSPREGGSNTSRNITRPYNAQGDFLLANVSPGSYTLIASSSENGKVVAARMPLEVGNSSVDGITLTLVPGAELRGRLKVEGTPGDPKNFQVRFASRSGGGMFGPGGGGQQGGALNQDGTFTLTNVMADIYDIRVSGLPDGGYVKSIRLGSAEVTDTGLDFSSGVVAAELTVTVSMSAGQLDGTVQNDKSEPVSDAMVVLVPEGPRRESDRYYVTAGTDQTGRFTLKNITPGEYRVYAFDEVPGSAYMDPDWLKPHDSKGERVSVKESSRDTMQLKLVVTGGL